MSTKPTGAYSTTLPQWPKAYPASRASAVLKLLNEDFIVTELPLQLPAGEGEHIWKSKRTAPTPRSSPSSWPRPLACRNGTWAMPA